MPRVTAEQSQCCRFWSAANTHDDSCFRSNQTLRDASRNLSRVSGDTE
jgi:hypothetical protein